MAKRESKKISVGKIVSIVLISLSALLLVLSFSGRFFSGGFRDFCNFFVGSFGISLYGILAAVIVASALYLSGRRIHIPLRYVINFVAMYVVVVVFVHTLTTLFLFNFDYATYVGYVYNFYDYVPSFGGVVLGSVSYALQAGLTVWGASILLIALLAVNILFCVNFFNAIATHKLVLTGEMRSFRKTKEDKSSTLTQSDNDNNIGPSAHTEQVAQQAQTDPRRAEAMRILFENVPQNGQTTEYSDNVGKPNTSDYNNNRPFGNSSGEDDFDSIFNPNSANVNNDYNTTNNGNISGESFFNSNRQSKDIDDLFGFNNTPNSSSNSQSSNSYSSSSNSTSKQEEGHSYDIFRRVDITADGTQLPKVNLYDDKQDAPNNSSTKAEQNYTSQQPPFTNKQPVVEDPTDIFVDNADSSPFVDNIVDVGSLKADSFVPGQCSAECASAAYSWVERAVRDSQRGLVSVIATAPVNKVSLRMAGIPFTGHTEMFAHLTGVKDPLTMFQVDNMRIFFLSRHVSLSEAIRMVTYERLMDYIPRCIRELDRLGVKGTLAVAALNPHAGDGGQFGTEERIIHRAVCDSRKAGLDVCGPIGADSVFHQALCGKYSAVLSLYHDQGHIAAKTYDFNRTVSLTLSMDVLRVSVDHGTAFDIAWKGLADETGMKETLRLALVHSS